MVLLISILLSVTSIFRVNLSKVNTLFVNFVLRLLLGIAQVFLAFCELYQILQKNFKKQGLIILKFRNTHTKNYGGIFV